MPLSVHRLGMLLLLGLTGAAAAAPSGSQDPAAEPVPYPPTLTVVYDVRDLLLPLDRVVPEVETGLAVRKILARLPAAPDRDELELTLMDELRDAVDPETWRARGGAWAMIQSLNGNLIVTTTRDRHDRIQRILTARRAERSVQVLVEARMILVERAFFERVRLRLDLHKRSPGGAWGSALLSAVDAETVRVALAASPTVIDVAAPRVIVLDRHAAMVVIDSRRAVKLPSADGSGRSIEVRPLDGTGLWLAPAVSADRKSVRLDVNPRLAELVVDGDVVEEIEAQVTTSVDIPDGRMMLFVLPLARNRLVTVRTEKDPDGKPAVREIVREPVRDLALDDRVALVLIRAEVMIVEEERE